MVSSRPPPPSSPKREHLLDVAERLFYRDGYRAVGIDTILAEAGVAKMTLYHHFSSKDDLIVEVLQRRGQRLGSVVAERLAAAGKSPRRRLLALFDWYADWFRESDFNGCAMIRAVAEYPARDSVVHQTVERLKQSSLARLGGLLQELGVKAPETVAEQVFLLFEGALVRAHTTGHSESALTARKAALVLIDAALSES